MWEDSREEGSPPSRWSEFVDAFIDHFLPTETKAAHAAEFESLKQGSMSVWESHMRFTRLSKYAIYMFPTMEARVRRGEDHGEHLKAVLQTLYQHKLYAKFSKCEFWLESATFLGHVIFGEGIKVDLQKIVVVKNWPRPTTPTEIHSFLGLAGYCRKFVKGFSTRASPFAKLTQKAVKFLWSDACERSFQELKSRLTKAPLLTLPEGTNGFVRRWLELLKDYVIDILYHPGKAIVVAYAFSQTSMGSLAHLEANQRPLAKEVHRLASLGVRLTDSSEGGVIVQNRAESSLVVEVKYKQYNDPLLVQLKEGIHKHKTMAFSLGIDDGTLRYQGRLCVPNVDVSGK
ncbi:uncharacterized protein [Nicotiana tomentosiformis]|uniref:uncharacterized protein n=1 Tax=Nicotiana tomentosiformis TaxID=4098 RepID=UPI00388CE6AF